MAKMLITGGVGFIGSNLVDRLIKDGYKVIVLDNLSGDKRENLNPTLKETIASNPLMKRKFIYHQEKANHGTH